MKKSTMVLILVSMFSTLANASERFVHLKATDTEEEIIEKAASVVPTDQQYAWQTLELTAFVHFGMNTFSDKEVGDGRESPKLFSPVKFDAEQWLKVLKLAGFKQLILTTKHADGFCLWPTNTTDYSVKASPYKSGTGDIVKEVATACKAAGIKFGIYISYWDRHESIFGTSQYLTFFKAQLTELLTAYGDISEVWIDDACFPDYDSKCSNVLYGWKDMLEVYDLIKRYQPNAIYMARDGHGIRWSGNEIGSPRENEWSVVPQWEDESLPGDLGTREKIISYAHKNGNLIWRPSESYVSIRPSWFYHSNQDNQVKSLDKLMKIYYDTTGNNSQLLLNIPPNSLGLISDVDAERLREFKAERDRVFAIDYAKTALISLDGSSQAIGNAENTVDGDPKTYWTPARSVKTSTLIYFLNAPHLIDTVVLKEYIRLGQRIDKVHVDVFSNGEWKKVATLRAVGYMKVVRFEKLFATQVRISIVQARVWPTLEHVGIHYSGP